MVLLLRWSLSGIIIIGQNLDVTLRGIVVAYGLCVWGGGLKEDFS